MKKLWISATLLLLSGCSCPGHFLQEANVSIKNHSLYYNGETSVTSAKYALALVRQHPEINRLVITSSGGDAVGGMLLGDWVHRQQITVEVRQQCLASCANYIVTASPNIYVAADTKLAWFDGAWQPNTDRPWYTFLIPGYDADHNLTLADWRAAEHDFFLRIGVREEITILGEVGKFKQQRQRSGMWSYSKAALKMLGVKKIEFANETSFDDVEQLHFATEELATFLAKSPLAQEQEFAGL